MLLHTVVVLATTITLTIVMTTKIIIIIVIIKVVFCCKKFTKQYYPYFNVCTMHLVQFIILTNKCTTYILYIVYAATKQKTATCCNYKSLTDCILSFNNDHVNILI